MNLPNISDEQKNIIEKLENNNVIVDSVAGSGKTTTNLFIAKCYNKMNILLLTYNARLKLETRTRIDSLHIKNMEAHSFHAFCYKYYGNYYNDEKIYYMLQKKVNPKEDINFDIIIIDEAQDLTPLYYELICKICNDNKKIPKFCILGDKYQSIFEYNNADSRYMMYSNYLFNINDYEWVKCKLSTSYRVPKEICDFVNVCMIDKNRIKFNKISGNKPRYIVCDTWDREANYVVKEVKYYLNLGYHPQDIFILASSIKNKQGPAGLVEKLLIKEKIPIFIPSAETKIMNNNIKKKLVISTFHQVKGLERKVIIILGFDASYFYFFKKNSDYSCTNELYVAVTRSIERISLIHNYEFGYLYFLKKIEEYCDVIKYNEVEQKPLKEDVKIKIVLIEDIIRHIPINIIINSVNLFEYEIKRNPENLIMMTDRIKASNTVMNVHNINKISIILLTELKITGKIEIIDIMKESKIECDDIAEFSIDKLLKLATQYDLFQKGYLFKNLYINKYDWLYLENIQECMQRIETLSISKNCKFNFMLDIDDKVCTELLGVPLRSYIDCVDFDNKIIYKFECREELNKENYIYLAIQKYMILKLQKIANQRLGDILKKLDTPLAKILRVNYKYVLYNFLTNEYIEIKSNLNNLTKMMEIIINKKYKDRIADNANSFLSENLVIFNKYFGI